MKYLSGNVTPTLHAFFEARLSTAGSNTSLALLSCPYVCSSCKPTRMFLLGYSINIYFFRSWGPESSG